MTSIRWLVQSIEDAPDAAETWLNPREVARLEELTVEKRRRDWLLGRWTAKRLLQSMLAEEGQEPLPLAALVIDNDPDGAPFAARADGGDLWRLPVSLSISHSGDHAFSALWAGPDVAVGADIERIEPRAEALVTTFFAPEEIDLIRQTPLARRDMLVTTIWSAKEAALKALRLGLRADTRRIVWLPSVFHPLSTGWAPVDIRCDPALLPGDPTFFALSGWWRIQGDYALTLAALAMRK